MPPRAPHQCTVGQLFYRACGHRKNICCQNIYKIWADQVVAASWTGVWSPWKWAERLSELRSPMTPSWPTVQCSGGAPQSAATTTGQSGAAAASPGPGLSPHTWFVTPCHQARSHSILNAVNIPSPFRHFLKIFLAHLPRRCPSVSSHFSGQWLDHE